MEEDSFAAAACKLARAQSAITYAAQKLENQYGVSLSMIAPALRRFHAAFPIVQLPTVSATPQDALGQMQEHDADLGVFLMFPNLGPRLQSYLITDMNFVALVTPDHPLASLPA